MILVRLTDRHVRPEGLAACRVVESNALTERAFRAVANLSARPDAPARFVLEPGAFEAHVWSAESGVVSHTGYVESFPGPYPFVPDAATSA